MSLVRTGLEAPSFAIPPAKIAEFPLIVQLVTVGEEEELKSAPPSSDPSGCPAGWPATFPTKRQLTIVGSPPRFKTAPPLPKSVVELLRNWESKMAGDESTS